MFPAASFAPFNSIIVGCIAATLLACSVNAQSKPSSPQTAESRVDSEPEAQATEKTEAKEVEPPKSLPEPKGLVRMNPKDEVWIDMKKKRVVVGGRIALNRGMLEMFACPKGTKEHESVVSVNALAQTVHAALLAIGAKSGKPAQYDPEYKPASGDVIQVTVLWEDEQGKPHNIQAQQWIRQVKTKKPMSQQWVFAGSGFWKDEDTGREHYLAESGELICVSNFSTATMDVNVESSQSNAGLLFEAWTERIPPLGAPVRLVLEVAK